jgi:hypothetical protein
MWLGIATGGEHDNGLLDSREGGEFLDYVNDDQLLKKDFASY